MAPKKKGAKKQQDDWEADLGESIDPVAQAEEAAQNGEADQTKPATEEGDDGEAGGGGLLAALRKNKTKRAKKGKAENDFVEGEDPTANGEEPATDLGAKAPEEATFDDDEDAFAAPGKKGKGGKKQPAQALVDDDDDNDSVASGAAGVKSKKEKEKEKKEREKQRKKEQVSH